MTEAFDFAAANYDASFTNTVIGSMQRKYVYRHLEKFLPLLPGKEILEINCGTGEDAIRLATKGFQVIATDVSEEMINIASKKSSLVEFKKSDIRNLSADFPNRKFDMIFSNFGGLNCLEPDELKAFFKASADMIADNGILFMVVMPRQTITEQLYFAMKGKPAEIFRRKKRVLNANVDGNNVQTYYYDPDEIKSLMPKSLRFDLQRPVGFFIPPSYLEPLLRKNRMLASFIDNLEQVITGIGSAAKYSDHYLISFIKK